MDIEKVIHAIKTAIACLLGYLVTSLLNLNNTPWVVISVLVVMCAQLYVGSVFQKSILRLLGTLLGCVFGSIALIVYGATPWTIMLTLALSSFVFAYIAISSENLSYAGTLGAVTTAIIIMSYQPTIEVALYRCLEISLGIIIAATVSQFILPIHSRTHLHRTQVETLKQLRDYYSKCMSGKIDTRATAFQDLEQSIIQSLTKQRQLAKQAQHEKLDRYYDAEHFLYTLYCEKEVLRCIDFMYYAMMQLNTNNVFFSHSSPLFSFNEQILQFFNQLIHALIDNHKEQISIPSINNLKYDIHRGDLSPQDNIDLNGLLFSAQRLITSLTKLANLLNLQVV